MDQPPATTSPAAPAQPGEAVQTDDAAAPAPHDSQSAGFGSRGRLRRRARFLRKARELAYRDLGGLVYSLHRFGQRNDSLVLAKLATLTRIDAELRALEASLGERQPVTVLREAGITACPRCAAIHSGEDRFCPNCGLPMSRNVDLPIAGAAAASAAAAPPVPARSAPQPRRRPPAAIPRPSSAATASFAPIPAAAVPTSPAAPPPSGAPGPAGAPAASPAPAQAPVTQAHPRHAPAGGHSPVPPVPGNAPSPGEDDQPTEIIRPPAAGS